MTDTMTEPLVSDEAFQNLFIRYCNMQDGHDLIIVRKADAGELIAVVREMVATPHSHVTCWEGYYETCVFCGAAVEVEECAADCLRKRAEALLARMDKVTE